MGNNGFSNIIYTMLISFFGALCKEINDKSHTSESFSIFFGEILLHGFSGWLFGLSANKYFGLTDLTVITIFAGIGGLFGYDLIKIVLKMILTTVANSKNIELDESDMNDLGKPKDYNKKKKH